MCNHRGLRCVLVFAAILALLPGMVADGFSAAVDFPRKTITILCHSSPGSPVDLMARQLADGAAKILGVPVVVETRTGGSGAVAMAYLLSQPTDGYTVYAMTRSNADLFATGEIKDFTWKDLTYLIRVQTDPFVLAAHPSAPFKDARELISYAKKNPGQVKVGGFGSGSAHHVAAMKFAKAAGIKITWVPYPGGAAAVKDVLGGHVPVVHTNPSTIIKQVQAGRLISVATSAGTRLPALPDMPTYKELGLEVEDYHWRGVAARKGVPEDRIKILHDAFKKVMETPAFKDYTVKNDLLPGYLGTSDFNKLFGETVEENIAVQRELGLTR